MAELGRSGNTSWTSPSKVGTMMVSGNRKMTFDRPSAKGSQMRTCVWCDAPLPEPKYKGHRRREFCPPPKTCKQKHYIWHKKMKQDADALAEPYWKAAYAVLVGQFKALEQRLQERLIDLEEDAKRIELLEKSVQYYENLCEALQVDYAARLKALGLADKDIEEFHAYWNAMRKRLEMGEDV